MILLPLFITSTFLISSLILNLLQLCIFLVIKPLSLSLYRRINYYLIYSSWSQVVGIAEWFSNCYARVYADDDVWETFGKDHAIIIMNHKYEVDWLYSWIIADKLKILAGSKSFAKSSLKKLPIIGWAWIFAEMIFLERNWEKDSVTLTDKLDAIMDYTDTKCLILLFAEGTRYTKEKYDASLLFAKEKGLPQLKHHLLPRTKGFNYCVKHLKNKMPAIYDIQLAFPKDEQVSVKKILWGNQLIGDAYIRKYNMKDIPVDDDKQCSEFLYKIYREKDELMDNYWKTGKFPGECRHTQRRIWGFLNWVLWALVIGLPILYVLIFKVLLSGNATIIAIATTVMILGATGIYIMLGVTQAKKGSSYGANSPSRSPSDSNLKDLDNKMETLIEENNDACENKGNGDIKQ